jgi:hypothetical protein
MAVVLVGDAMRARNVERTLNLRYTPCCDIRTKRGRDAERAGMARRYLGSSKDPA